jgi:hypothetical protein
LISNIALESAIRNLLIDTNGTLVHKSDDINLLAGTCKDLTQTCMTLKDKALEIGLEINVDKTNILAQNRSNRT